MKEMPTLNPAFIVENTDEVQTVEIYHADINGYI